MPRIRILAPVALVVIGLGLIAAVLMPLNRPPSFHATDLGTGTPAPDFTLRSDHGDVTLSDLRGRVTLLFFGYTSCPDICPLTLRRLAAVTAALDADAEDVQVVLVSVDPELDSPRRVAAYARGFDPSFIGLTGTRVELQRVAADYGIYMGEPEPAPVSEDSVPLPDHDGHGGSARLIAHSPYVFGIDRDGRMRLLWGGDASAEQIAADVRELLQG